jgi:hypothetical protein
MDLALCSINYKTLDACSMQEYLISLVALKKKHCKLPIKLLIIEKHFMETDLMEIKADKNVHIGSNKDGVADIFTNHTIQLTKR